MAPVSARYLVPDIFALNLFADTHAAQAIDTLAHIHANLGHGQIELFRRGRFPLWRDLIVAHHPMEQFVGIGGKRFWRYPRCIPFELGLSIFIQLRVAGGDPHPLFHLRLTRGDKAIPSLNFDQTHPA